MSKDQKLQAETFAESLLNAIRKGEISYSNAVSACANCIDSSVGARAFKIVRKAIKNGN